MNKTFKVVFNKVRGALVVTNECTKSCIGSAPKLLIASTSLLILSASSIAAGLSTSSPSGTYDYARSIQGTNVSFGKSDSEYTINFIDQKAEPAAITVRRYMRWKKENGSLLTFNGKKLSVSPIPASTLRLMVSLLASTFPQPTKKVANEHPS